MGTWHLFRDLHAVPCGRQRIKWDGRQVEMKLDEVARATLPVEGPVGHAKDFALMPVLYAEPWGFSPGHRCDDICVSGGRLCSRRENEATEVVKEVGGDHVGGRRAGPA